MSSGTFIPRSVPSPPRSLGCLSASRLQLLSGGSVRCGCCTHVIRRKDVQCPRFTIQHTLATHGNDRDSDGPPALISRGPTTRAAEGKRGVQSVSPNPFNHSKPGDIFQVWSLLPASPSTVAMTDLIAPVLILILPNLSDGRSVIQLVV